MSSEPYTNLVSIEHQTYGVDPASGAAWYCRVPHDDIVEVIGKLASFRAALLACEERAAGAEAQRKELRDWLDAMVADGLVMRLTGSVGAFSQTRQYMDGQAIRDARATPPRTEPPAMPPAKLLSSHQIATVRKTATGWRERDGKTDEGTAAGLLFALLGHIDALAAAPPDASGPTPDREQLGREVREEWVAFTREQPNPKPHHLLPWEELDEANKEVDRRIGERLWCAGWVRAYHDLWDIFARANADEPPPDERLAAAIAYVEADNAVPANIMAPGWGAAVARERDARKRLHDAVAGRGAALPMTTDSWVLRFASQTLSACEGYLQFSHADEDADADATRVHCLTECKGAREAIERVLSGSPAAPPVTTDAGLREALTSAYSMLSLLRYRSPGVFHGDPGLPDVAEADVVLGRCRAALSTVPPAQRVDGGGAEPREAMTFRPLVLAMAAAMETKLRKHDGDRGERGWEHDTADDLIAYAWDHMHKLYERRRDGVPSLLYDAADVANMLGMACDVEGLIAPASSAGPDKETKSPNA